MKKYIIMLVLLCSVLNFSEPLRRLSVTGVIEREVAPDIAKMNFRVYTKNEDIQKAGKENETNFQNFRNELNKKKIKISNIETYNYYTNKTVENDTSQNERTEYAVSLAFSVLINDLTSLPQFIELSEKNSIKKMNSSINNRNLYYFYISDSNVDKETAISNIFKDYDSIKSQIKEIGINDNYININSYQVSEKKVKIDKPAEPKDFYNIYNDFMLELSDISKINEVIQIAESNKINLQNSIVFDISNKEAIESELYNQAFEQTKIKATSILKSSEMKLGDPLAVSESVSYQNYALDQFNDTAVVARDEVIYMGKVAAERPATMITESEYRNYRSVVDYKPQVIKLTQNISVLFEMK